MKKLLLLCTLLMVGITMMGAVKKTKLRVLYVGGHSNMETFGTDYDKAENEKSIVERTVSFEQFLKEYFTTVKVVQGKDYNYKMSYDYDVTIMDGVPTPLKERVDVKDGQRFIKIIYAQYFPEDFDRPVVTIAELGETLGRYIGLKSDWYCLCLDNYAHTMRTNHPIFKGPYKVNMKLEEKPTPEGAMAFAPMVGETLPPTTKMMKIGNTSYQQRGKNIKIGMVSRPWGYEDSPECEWISGGLSSKSIDAMAIGRQGSFLHWGFAAAPSDMTEQAKPLFINAVIYISKFAGQRILARKMYESISTRVEAKEMAYRVTKKCWEEYKSEIERFNKQMKHFSDSIKGVQAAGGKIKDSEKMYLQWQPQEIPVYEVWVKQRAGKLYQQFGLDEAAYAKYYEENTPYFYGTFDDYGLLLDEDAKSLGIPNNDKRLLDKAILLWETTEDVAKGKRLLERYTLLRYDNPKQYREWYLKYKDKLFFTESGGWKWLVNSKDKNVPGNDYSVLKYNEAPPVQKTPEISGDTNRDNPVLISGVVNELPNGEKELVIRMKMHEGFHVYGYVSDADPYIATTFDIQTEGDWKKDGELKIPAFKNLGTTGTTIYEGDVLFRQRLKGSGKGKVTCTVNYQTCDEHACLPPRDVTLEFGL
ncbi:MAG: hypothetical protein ILA07_06940 [Prevotella sp.]|nr:hypothetical protein [Prevotella sp.]